VTADDRGEREPATAITWADHIGHDGRIGRLEDWREAHEQEHERHIATKEFVYRVAIGAGVAAIGIGVAIAEAIAGG